MNLQQAIREWQADLPEHIENGVSFAYDAMPRAYVPDEYRYKKFDTVRAYRMAMDAVPAIVSTPNSAVPAFLTTLIDPKVFKVLFAPNNAAKIFGEVRKGTWLDETVMFPTVEHTGEVSSYGDYSENGSTGANTMWPQRQAYLFQTIKEYGDRELERAGLAKINWVSEIDTAAATILNKFANFTYFYGVQGLQNYGLLNDPTLTAALTPAAKAAGGVKWINSSGQVVATPNEVFNDIQSMFYQLVIQTQGLVQADAKMTLVMSPASEVALTATNSFNVNVRDVLKKSFPNIRFETAVQYDVSTSANPQGQSAGRLVQLFIDEIEGQDTGYCAFNEKMYAQPIVRALSSYKQKVVGGTWGTIIRQPFAIVNMIGI
jgi:hypothetical protein